MGVAIDCLKDVLLVLCVLQELLALCLEVSFMVVVVSCNVLPYSFLYCRLVARMTRRLVAQYTGKRLGCLTVFAYSEYVLCCIVLVFVCFSILVKWVL